MSIKKLLVANRGEIAIRILRAAADLGIPTVAVYATDEAESLHLAKADEAAILPGRGVPAYLDSGAILDLARELGCDAIHPGYGFLSENAEFALACAQAGVAFVGPGAETLSMFGDKAAARDLAEKCGVPVLPGSQGATDVAAAEAFFEAHGPTMIKAIGGGGGRGMRAIHEKKDIAAALEICQGEALQAFGNGDVFVERLLQQPRHIEVQIIGDGSGAISHLGERECSIQRRHQKLVEMAPAPGLAPLLRERLTQAAVKLAGAVDYRNVGTFEFLIEGDDYFFIEANPRLQVEHTVTEEVWGVDLVQTQLHIAGGATLSDLNLAQDQVAPPRGQAMQVRINMETIEADGSVRPSGGTLEAFEMPSGPGIRVDTFGYPGYRTSPSYDSLLAKLIAHANGNDFTVLARKTYRALCECRITGLASNISFLQNLVTHPDFRAGKINTQFIDTHLDDLVGGTDHQRLFLTPDADDPADANLVGVKVDASDPLAVLSHGKSEAAPTAAASSDLAGPDGTVAISAPMLGTIVSVDVTVGDDVYPGRQVLIMEAMKMQHVIEAEFSGIVRQLPVQPGDTVYEGGALAYVAEQEVEIPDTGDVVAIDLDYVRPDLAEVMDRQGVTLDDRRPNAVARRRKTNQRTVRENIEQLCDAGSFKEIGSLVLAARRGMHSIDELIERTPADGLVTGLGRINGHLFPDETARCAVMSYDYTVLAGTQGKNNHKKKDRMFEMAEKWRLPIVFFTEGGGGRPGDTDMIFAANLHVPAFHLFGRLSGLVPLVGITSGRCFAGNAVLLGCCDVVIATENSTIGMGGPAMIEGGGLGVFRPEEVGPMSVQVPNGVVDVAVKDEEEAVTVAQQYIGYFQGAVEDWECVDQRLLRQAIPEDRLRIYDVRKVVEQLSDTGSVLELRAGFGLGMVTALARIEGRPVGIVANNPNHLAGAIDSDAADKAARFMQLCDAYDLPLVFLCDTPGNMVGPVAEQTALVRHCCRLYVIGANVTVPTFTIVLRKGYGLGAQGMAGGGFHAPMLTISWPTGEFGGMGLEGAVKLGRRDELMAIEDPEERMDKYEEMVAAMYAQGKAINAASLFELDNVIDPADTREWIMAGLRSAPPPAPREGKKRPWIDTW
ncbi:MAG: carbamoyl-phosphate synthase large subunit [Rhodospirillaceae bacterium]|jgi:acetyl/propionyl-CoA carboxylase alpha subunit/acetyl-CoA carboxylase carboxyltransferase component|nr:carbamoyl-phosphate synthase large subunit [Rhodospirillaceae bacterium]MBT5897886.1 carbamoyl-phosphate synthase large subunit [Rhodospirillaceae bacterium]MBT6427948.1 carbamoyl-phosphate synthase large subunit [Rhodospirillaceae bacterium]MBT7756206.1 carbamoyl-phosphate synthase large subunit [Rhodospirillaceae bacterium]